MENWKSFAFQNYYLLILQLLSKAFIKSCFSTSRPFPDNFSSSAMVSFNFSSILETISPSGMVTRISSWISIKAKPALFAYAWSSFLINRIKLQSSLMDPCSLTFSWIFNVVAYARNVTDNGHHGFQLKNPPYFKLKEA